MSPFAVSFTSFLSLGTVIINSITVVLILAFFASSNNSKNKDYKKNKNKGLIAWVAHHALGLATIVSLCALIGSLIYSSVIGFVPCELCWYQRICLFSQAVIFLVAWFRAWKFKIYNQEIFIYSLVLSTCGVLVAAFQYYGQMFNPSILGACEATGVSCAKIYFVSYGYITIPMMSLSMFLLLAMIAIIRLRRN